MKKTQKVDSEPWRQDESTQQKEMTNSTCNLGDSSFWQGKYFGQISLQLSRWRLDSTFAFEMNW